jgi:DNA polymerase-3 subunit epsilon
VCFNELHIAANLSAMPFLSLDLEMSGPEPGWNDIIQIGAVLLDDNWNELGEFIENVYPENEEAFSSSSEKIHGLTLADLEDAPLIYDVLQDFEQWACKTLNRNLNNTKAPLNDVIICGQSILSDISFLQYSYRHEKKEWPFSYKLLELFSVSHFAFRVLESNGHKVPKNRGLGAIAAHFGLEREDKNHNALEDAKLSATCFRKLYSLANQMNIK